MNFESRLLHDDASFTFFGNDVVALPRQKQTVSQVKSPEVEISETLFGEMSDGDEYEDLGDTGSDSGIEAVEPGGADNTGNTGDSGGRPIPLGKRMNSSTSLLSTVTTQMSRSKRPPSVSSSASKASKTSSSRTAATGPKRARIQVQPLVSGFESGDESFDMQASKQRWASNAPDDCEGDYNEAPAREEYVRRIKRVMKLGPTVTWA
jgi:hypothetical protein